jgi:hypothetical protein
MTDDRLPLAELLAKAGDEDVLCGVAAAPSTSGAVPSLTGRCSQSGSHTDGRGPPPNRVTPAMGTDPEDRFRARPEKFRPQFPFLRQKHAPGTVSPYCDAAVCRRFSAVFPRWVADAEAE